MFDDLSVFRGVVYAIIRFYLYSFTNNEIEILLSELAQVNPDNSFAECVNLQLITCAQFPSLCILVDKRSRKRNMFKTTLQVKQ